ncbi:MAG: ACT domain-containing protein, partial [Bacilli bacterium]
LVEIMGVLSAQKIPISQINAKLHIPTMTATISATIQVSDAHRLHDIFVVIKQISDVRDVVRVFH